MAMLAQAVFIMTMVDIAHFYGRTLVADGFAGSANFVGSLQNSLAEVILTMKVTMVGVPTKSKQAYLHGLVRHNQTSFSLKLDQTILSKE